jgi:hypothetical protein
MSEYTLKIGDQFDDRRTKLCLSHLHSLALIKKSFLGKYSGEASEWINASGQPLKTISLLNLATTCAFNEYVANVFEKPEKELMDDADFGNLPWWQYSMWIPVDFSPPRAFEKDPEFPFFFGSAQILDRIKASSQISLTGAPKDYLRMIENYDEFERSFDGLKDQASCIQWVWHGLHDAAQLSVEKKLPILGNGI